MLKRCFLLKVSPFLCPSHTMMWDPRAGCHRICYESWRIRTPAVLVRFYQRRGVLWVKPRGAAVGWSAGRVLASRKWLVGGFKNLLHHDLGLMLTYRMFSMAWNASDPPTAMPAYMADMAMPCGYHTLQQKKHQKTLGILAQPNLHPWNSYFIS